MASSPLEQFTIKTILPIQVGGYDVSFTNSSLVMAVAVGLAVFVMHTGVKRDSLVPGRLQSLAEMIYEFVVAMVRDNAGAKAKKYIPFVFSLFVFVLLGNLLGMVPMSFTFTSHIVVTLVLAMIVFIFVTLLGIAKHGLHFFSLFVPHGAPPMLLPLIVPIEIISYLTRPISLSVRLFANMLAGHAMMKVFAGFAVMLGVVGGLVPLALIVVLTAFEIGIAMIQAYVFSILTCIYLKDALDLH